VRREEGDCSATKREGERGEQQRKDIRKQQSAENLV